MVNIRKSLKRKLWLDAEISVLFAKLLKEMIKKIALNYRKIGSVSEELKINSRLKSDFVVKFLSSWIENNNYNKNKDCINSGSKENTSYSHSVLDTNRTLLLHIQMEFCSKTLKELNISNSLDVIIFYILYELFTELLECVNY